MGALIRPVSTISFESIRLAQIRIANMIWHTSSGVVTYDPHRGDMKANTSSWCVINTDKEITRYYRNWLKRQFHIHLHEPAWNAHISCIRGERLLPQHKHLWKKYHNQTIQFQYEHGDIQITKDKDQPGYFYWIRVLCPMVDNIRNELGLISSWKYHHMTIGRTYY